MLYATSSGSTLSPFTLSSEADVASASLRFLRVEEVIVERVEVDKEASSDEDSNSPQKRVPRAAENLDSRKVIRSYDLTEANADGKEAFRKYPMTRPYPILAEVSVSAFHQLIAAKDSLRGFQLNPRHFIGSELTKRIAPWWQLSHGEAYDKGCEREVEDFFDKLDIVIRDMSGQTRKGQGYLHLALNNFGQLDRDCISAFDDDCRNTLTTAPGTLDDKERRLILAVQTSDPSIGLYIGNALSIAKYTSLLQIFIRTLQRRLLRKIQF